MLNPDEQMSVSDFQPLIDEELDRISRGEPTEIDPEIKRLVQESVKNLPDKVIQEYKLQLVNQKRRFGPDWNQRNLR